MQAGVRAERRVRCQSAPPAWQRTFSLFRGLFIWRRTAPCPAVIRPHCTPVLATDHPTADGGAAVLVSGCGCALRMGRVESLERPSSAPLPTAHSGLGGLMKSWG